MSARTISESINTYQSDVRRQLACRPLSDEQKQVLSYMREFFIENDQLPPAPVIAQHFGWKSPTSAQRHLEQLARLRRIEVNAVGKLRFVRAP